jgi:hypothetical protein
MFLADSKGLKNVKRPVRFCGPVVLFYHNFADVGHELLKSFFWLYARKDSGK